MRDWRGNDYTPGEQLGTICSWPTCAEPAVRHRCNAEGDTNRTHWHGEVHVLRWEGNRHSSDLPGLGGYCDAHGRSVLQENARLRNAS